MARYVKEHYIMGVKVLAYWTPDNSECVIPCKTKEEAESLESELEESRDMNGDYL